MNRRCLLGLFLNLDIILAADKNRSNKSKFNKPGGIKPLLSASPFVAVPVISQKIQNQQVEKDGLERLQDDNDLERLKQEKKLVPLPVLFGLEIKDLDPKWHFCRPWVAQFIKDLVEKFRKEKRFPNKKLFITSAIRTAERQNEIIKKEKNLNAISVEDENPSVHMAGVAIDITKKQMSYEEILWMRKILLPIHEKVVYVVEEFRQSCFHIMVYKNYRKPLNW